MRFPEIALGSLDGILHVPQRGLRDLRRRALKRRWQKTLRRLCKLGLEAFQLGAGGCGLSFWIEPGVSQLLKFLDPLIVFIEKHLSFQQHLPERLVAGFRSGRRRGRLRGRDRPSIGCLRRAARRACRLPGGRSGLGFQETVEWLTDRIVCRQTC